MKDISFFTHREKYIYYNYPASDGRARGSTGVTGDIDNLDKVSKKKLQRIEILISDYIGLCEKSNTRVLKQEINNIVKKHLGKVPKGSTLLDLVERYISEAQKGTVISKSGKRYTAGTIEAFDGVITRLKLDKLGNMDISAIKDTDIKGFISRLAVSKKLRGEGHIALNTVTSYTNLLISIISATLTLGWHSNPVTRESNLTVKQEVIDYPVYYSIEELKKLHEYKLPPKKKEVIDVFIFGCFTCLRHSDYYLTDYKDAYNGSELVIKLKKRSNQVRVPLHPIALDILKKYDFRLPKVHMRVFNTYIKDLVKKAGFTEKVLFTRTHGGQLVREYKEKWELTTSHTMRRSFATNALKMGMKEWVVMAIGGWKSEASFRKYKRMSEQDVLNDALTSDFYKVGL